MILLGMFAGLMILHVSVAFAAAASPQSATMLDILVFMNSHKDLPEYCQCRMAEAEFRDQFRNDWKPAQVDWPPQFAMLRAKWTKQFGASWGDLHHYCFGIMRLNTAMGLTGKSEEVEMRKKGTLTWALQEFRYIEGSASGGSFPLWPQLFMYEYQVYSRLGQPVKAQRALQRAAQYRKKPESPR
jgi:hypothetical protein